MSSPARTRIPAVLAAALVGVVLTAGPAGAAPAEIPPDVRALIAGDAVGQAHAGAAGIRADFSGSRADDVHEVFLFSMDFVEGVDTTRPVISAGRWMAGIERGDRVLGTLEVWKPAGGPAELAGFSNDVATGSVLGTLAPAEILIHDEPNGAYYALDGRTVRPLNDWALKALPEPADLSVLQDVVAAQHARAVEESTIHDHPPALTVSLMAMTLTGLAGASLAIHGRRRRRLAAPDAQQG
jgi:hypothetical protein